MQYQKEEIGKVTEQVLQEIKVLKVTKDLKVIQEIKVLKED
jgi:hypothetical protein